MKKLLSLLTALVMLSVCAAAEPAPVLQAEPGALHPASFPCYVINRTTLLDGEDALPFWFEDSAEDLPYMDLADWSRLMMLIMNSGKPAPSYSLEMEYDQDLGVVILSRETGTTAIFDFERDMIHFTDYVDFMRSPDRVYLGISAFSSVDSEQEPFLLTLTGSRSRRGEITVLNLKDYDIPMVEQDGKYLVPVQTLAALFLSPFGLGLYFNGQAAFLVQIDHMNSPQSLLKAAMENPAVMTPEVSSALDSYDGPEEELFSYMLDVLASSSEEGAEAVRTYMEAEETYMFPVYNEVPPAERSDALAVYGYNELCFELDCFYGLKESHSIRNFNQFFTQTGLADGLLSPSAEKADQALADMAEYWLDDSHSSFISPSHMSEMNPDSIQGYSSIGFERKINVMDEARRRYPEATLPYYELGDTAYVTFDGFEIAPDASGTPDYYGLSESGQLPSDTIGLIIQAHREITREDSPVRNVVLDLSCNLGGLARPAVYTLCWFLGEAQVSMHDTFTGAESTMTYAADINLDHVCDREDTLAGRGLNLYCLISPQSFSCGNLVPWCFKEDGSVTLLGKVSGGGACLVQPMNTAWGTSYQISGSSRLAFVKNGSYYDVDRGVEPDHIIDSYDHFFDRAALTEYIHGLY